MAEVCRSVLALLDRHERYAADWPPDAPHFPAALLAVTALCVARTPAVALPDPPEPVSVSGREPHGVVAGAGDRTNRT